MAETAAIVAVVATVIAAGVGTYSAVAQGQAAKESSKFNADVARNQALAEQQKSAFEAQQIRRRNLLRVGAQRAAFAKSGITIESGNDVITDSAIQGELEEMAALYGGNTAATYYKSKAKLSTMEGKNAQTAGYLSAAGTVLGGTAKTSGLLI